MPTEEEKRKRLRFLQLKKKKVEAEQEKSFVTPEDLELISLGDVPPEQKSIIGETGKLIGRGATSLAKGATEFVGGAIREPGETFKGIGAGLELGTKKLFDPAFKLFDPIREKAGLPVETLEDVEAKHEKLLEKPEGKRAAKVGEFGTKLGLGLAGSALVPGSGLISTLGKGAAANIPFAAQEAKEKGLGAGVADMAINTVVDVATLGAGKVIGKPIKDAIGNILQGVGKKVQMATIRPRDKAIREGFDINNVFKHGLEGNLETGLKKINTKFDNLTTELNQKIQSSSEKIDLVDMLNNVISDMTKNPSKSFGSNIETGKLFEKILSEIETVSPKGIINLVEAQNVKRAVGAMGAWQFGMRDAEATARENVYNRLYTEIRKEIEKSAPEGIKEINKQLGEIIPIERAIIQRIPVKQRQDLISLTDVVSTAGALASGPKGWGLVVLNRLSKSPLAGAKAFRTGETVKGLRQPFAVGKTAKEALQEETSRKLSGDDLRSLRKLKIF